MAIDYEKVLKEMKENDGFISLDTNFQLAKKVFLLTSRYDSAISNYLESLDNKEKRS